jgi:threonine dehydrogenase-like Zn-dependent dehydrogenase
MKATYIEFAGLGRVEVRTEEVSTGDLAPWEVVVRSESSLVSAGTELAGLHNTENKPDPKFPRRTGYACVGRVVARGAAVTDFAVGARVFFAGKHASVQRFTHGQDHQWGRLYPVPDDVPAEDAPFVCLAQIAGIAPIVTTLDLGDTVAVFGLGVIGNLAAQLYRIQGARVIGLDPVAARVALARQVGIADAVGAPAGEQVQAVLDRTGGRGAEVTVDAVGHSAVVENAVRATARFGQVVLLGTPRAPHAADLTPLLNAVHTQGLVVRGAHMWRLPAADVREAKRNVAWAYRTMFAFMRDGRLNVAPLRSHFVPPARAPEAYRGLQEQRDRYWGVVFDWRDA